MDSEMFEWDEAKDSVNQSKHGVSFYEAQRAFLDVKLHCCRGFVA